ncbi:hypothetical protein [Haladaptatus sp. DFWS20]|uniref:hypothetical protein n=1 Tax=Haladaptatus sp. DFWS20 TaxID=3403467 RepID=UPI003EBF3AE5
MTSHSVSDSERDPDDGRHLYGEPQHDVTADEDPDETLYGTAQHETSTSLDDFELFRLDFVAFDYRRFSQSKQTAQSGRIAGAKGTPPQGVQS